MTFTKSLSTIESLVLSHLFLAEKIAKSKKRKLSHISYDELKSAAYFGLVQAANSYKSSENDCFAAYAVWRIVGAIRDYLRELSWGPRHNLLKRVPEVDIAYCQNEPHESFFDDLIQQMPTLNKKVLRLYYVNECKIQDIAFEIGVHQSRVSQILSESRKRLKDLWKKHDLELWFAAA